MTSTSPDAPVIDLNRLVRRYGRTEAVNGLNLHVQVEAVDRLGPAVATDEAIEVDDRCVWTRGCHDCSARVRFCSNASNRSSARRRNSDFVIWR